MNAGKIICIIILFIFSLAAFVISCLQFKEKGFLYNNAYLYASEKEREALDKKPHYRQSAIIFLLMGMLFFILPIEIIFATKWLYIVEGLIIIAMLIYAIVSSIHIETKQ